MPDALNRGIREEAMQIIEALYGENASFREGQYEAIEATMTQKRTLVVQRTGWGKSLVYFVCTRRMRNQGKGVTMVVSPLLILMQNQMEAAAQMGLTCDALNSSVKDRRAEILDALEADEIDLLLVTPETLFGADVQARLKNIKIGLFVIDEAHCISDWGHDFRLDYSNLRTIISRLPPNVPVLATTATANDRVIRDLEQQLGGDIYLSKGPLTRESLSIQVLHMPGKTERYAWIIENLRRLPGSGIIYCLTQRDCDYLSDFLQGNGILAQAYYSRDTEAGKELNHEIEEQFKHNQIKAIVATIKLGMGYDKGDIAFVIHFQMPPNLVSYYQQIGRAGRNIAHADTFLMCGKEDEDILNYFIRTAFPTEEETNAIMRFVSEQNGVKQWQIDSALNIKRNRMAKALMFLLHDGFLRKEQTFYYATPKPYAYDREHYREITETRIREMEQMKALTRTTECYSKFVVNCLDDNTAVACGACANCLGREILPSRVSWEFLEKATAYLDGLFIPIEPRKMWVNFDRTPASKIRQVNQEGFCLSKYGDAGFGELVKREKYAAGRRFSEQLVGKSAELLRPFVREHQISHLCFVPSLRSDLVKDFAERLAVSLGLSFSELLIKTAAQPQKEMENSSHQCGNAYRSFFVADHAQMPERVLLVDDVVDSKWTMTVCGYRLMEAGCREVYPFALADSSQKEE